MTTLSDDAGRLLALFKPGRAANASALEKRFGTDSAAFSGALTELEQAGLVERDGKRLRRQTDAEISPEAARILAALPSDGSTVGNIRLRSRLLFDDETYARAKAELIEKKLVQPGIGRGGTLARVESQSDVRGRVTGLRVKKEGDLYQPFADWLQTTVEDQPTLFDHIAVTGSPSGRRRSSGQWSRPDVTQIRVVGYEYLPGVTVEVFAFELKRAVDAERLEGVYEAVAHGRWAHSSTLVVELESGETELSQTIRSEAARFGIGLYTMSRRADGQFDVVEQLETQPLTTPEPEKVNELLEFAFKKDADLRTRYRQAIRGT